MQIFARRACGYVFGTVSNAMLYSGCRRSGFGFPSEDARRDGAFPPETFTIRTLSTQSNRETKAMLKNIFDVF